MYDIKFRTAPRRWSGLSHQGTQRCCRTWFVWSGRGRALLRSWEACTCGYGRDNPDRTSKSTGSMASTRPKHHPLHTGNTKGCIDQGKVTFSFKIMQPVLRVHLTFHSVHASTAQSLQSAHVLRQSSRQSPGLRSSSMRSWQCFFAQSPTRKSCLLLVIRFSFVTCAACMQFYVFKG